MAFSYTPQIIFCHFFRSSDIVIWGLRHLAIAGVFVKALRLKGVAWLYRFLIFAPLLIKCA